MHTRNTNFIPFLVADRQASLKIIGGLDITKFNGKIGIMSHANTTDNFKIAFKMYPCIDKNICELIHKSCPYGLNVMKCKEGLSLKERTVKIADSGVFTKSGCMFENYENLFKEYEKMGTDYGIMIDHLRDIDATLLSAKDGMRTYTKKKRPFKLIGVAQGNNVEQYLECYKKLKTMGYKHIAIGGLLKKIKNSVRYTKVENENFMFEVIRKIREYDQSGWLFALGCYSRARQNEFAKLGIFGSDYKGWIFHYSKRYKNEKRAQRDRFSQVRKFLEDKIFGSRRLLIVPCSQRKITTGNVLPAIQVYDGPFYKLLRKYIRSFENDNGVDIYILSAKYGLIDPLKLIRPYDFRMTYDRAEALNHIVLKMLRSAFEKKTYSEVFINLGNVYLKAINGYGDLISKISPQTQIILANGRIGERMKEMKEWITNGKAR